MVNEAEHDRTRRFAGKPPQAGLQRELRQVYNDLKSEIFDFHLLPGDRFTETELANRYNVSRTPIRDALYRLKREGYLDVAFRSGWSVKPLDFRRFHELYELRILLECGAVERLCRLQPTPDLTPLTWPEDISPRISDPRQLAAIDEAFHLTLMKLAGKWPGIPKNPETSAPSSEFV